jgi:hypothetical protein
MTGGNMTEIVFKRIGGRVIPIKKAWDRGSEDRKLEYYKDLKTITTETIDRLNKLKGSFKWKQ